MVSAQQIDEMLAGSLTQEDEDAVLAELEAITQVGSGADGPLRPKRDALILTSVLICFSQGDVELPDVPSEELPESPERKGGQRFSESFMKLRTFSWYFRFWI